MSQFDYSVVSELENCHCVDRKDNLELWHFDGSVPTGENAHVRGLVYDMNTHELVARSQAFIPEIDPRDLPEDVEATLCEEGTVIRLFYYNDKWYCSTHHRIDAFSSYWGSNKSWGRIFGECVAFALGLEVAVMQAIKVLTDNLPTDYTHSFVVANHKESHIVCKTNTPKLLYVGSFSQEQDTMLDINIPSSEYTQMSRVDLRMNLNSLDVKQNPGYLVKVDGKQYKCLSDRYKLISDIRGTAPSIGLRYIELLCGDKNKLFQFMAYYRADNKRVFDDIDYQITDVARQIFRMYKKRYMEKMYVSFPSTWYSEINLTRALHQWHLSDRSANRVTVDRVKQEMFKMNPRDINSLLSHIDSYHEVKVDVKRAM